MSSANEEAKIVSLVSQNTELNWTAFPDRFVTFGNDLKLHVIESIREMPQIYGGIQLNELNYAHLLQFKSDLRFVKALASNNEFLRDTPNDTLVALGYNSGRVVLSSFDPNSTFPLVAKEFNPKTHRSCNTLDFSQVDNHLLASGFDKARNEHSVLVWDVAHTGTTGGASLHNSYNAISGLNKPLYEFCPNEMVHLIKWYQNKAIICGINHKYLKLFDLRDVSKPKGVFSKGVSGVSIDPHHENRFASFHENYIYVWDTRNFDVPLTTIGPESSNVVKVEWSPTRSNLLGALYKDRGSIQLYEYKDYKNLNDSPEPEILRREINPFERNNAQIISSFSWHPEYEMRMTVISTNSAIRDFKVVDRITLNWSPISEIIYTQGRRLQCVDSRDSIYDDMDDISVRMRNLAIQGYGLSRDKMWQLFPKNTPLYFVWKWTSRTFPEKLLRDDKERETSARSSQVPQDIPQTMHFFNKYHQDQLQGIYGFLVSETRGQMVHNSELVCNLPPLLSNNIKVYTSPSRVKAIQHCGWSPRTFSTTEPVDFDVLKLDLNLNYSVGDAPFDPNMPSEEFVRLNLDEGSFTRLAAVMIFNGKLAEAIEILRRASDFIAKQGSDTRRSDLSVSLNAIALALSGFVATAGHMERHSNSTLWLNMCTHLKPKLRDAYLKAIFTFINSLITNSNLNEIIEDENLDISDRVALACMYMNDSQLYMYLTQLKNRLLERYDLSAILLLGITKESVELFSKYVENTCDVQTISLLVLRSLPNKDLCEKPLVMGWIDNYKHLLDCWRLWNVRAQFDIMWYQNHQEEPKQRIYASCNYCRAPLASYTNHDNSTKIPLRFQQALACYANGRNPNPTSAANKLRTCTCSGCNKTLPRCALCLTQLGTEAGVYWRPGLVFKSTDRKLSPFSSWFSWCQTCRHGGHSAHLLEWFTENTHCPVAGCKCKCMSIDANARLTFNANVFE